MRAPFRNRDDVVKRRRPTSRVLERSIDRLPAEPATAEIPAIDPRKRDDRPEALLLELARA
jgi:hypothetical protein